MKRDAQIRVTRVRVSFRKNILFGYYEFMILKNSNEAKY